MKKERIEELFESNSTCDTYLNFMVFDEFVEAVRQIESELKLEWYKKLEKKLQLIMESTPFNPIVNMNTLTDYFNEIQNKIKELENEN